jgi:hypothetical protein
VGSGASCARRSSWFNMYVLACMFLHLFMQVCSGLCADAGATEMVVPWGPCLEEQVPVLIHVFLHACSCKYHTYLLLGLCADVGAAEPVITRGPGVEEQGPCTGGKVEGQL